jgi:hypothetical protein
MYHVIVTDEGKVIAKALREGLAEAVSYGKEKSSEGNLIHIYDALQDASGEILHLSKVLSFVERQEVT